MKKNRIAITPCARKIKTEEENYMIYLRLVTNPKGFIFKIGLKVSKDEWDSKKRKVRSTNSRSWMLNALIEVAEYITYNAVKDKAEITDIREIRKEIISTLKTLKTPIDIIRFHLKGSKEGKRLEKRFNIKN